MLEVLDSLSDAGHPDKPNEDAMGHSDAHAWVIDGATGVGEGNLLAEASDAAWLARYASAHFGAEAARHGADLASLTHQAIEDLARRFEALRQREPIGRYELPSAAMIMAHWDGAVLRCANFADCMMVVLTDSGQSHVFGGAHHDRLASGRARTAALLAQLQPGQTAFDLPEVMAYLRAARNRQNTEDGYWILGLDPHAVRHMRQWRLPLAEPATALLMSDGFAALAADYDQMTLTEMVATAREKGLAPLLAALREVEHVGDPQARLYPRFKRCDDATSMLLRLHPSAG